MNRGKLLATMCVTALALSTAPAWAQRGSRSSRGPWRRHGVCGRPRVEFLELSARPLRLRAARAAAAARARRAAAAADRVGGSAVQLRLRARAARDYVSVPVRPNRQSASEGRPRGGSPRSGGDSSARAVPRGSRRRRRFAVVGRAPHGRRRFGRFAVAQRRSRPTAGRATAAGHRHRGRSAGRLLRRRRRRSYAGVRATAIRATTGGYYYPGYAFGLGYFYDPSWYDPYCYGGLYGGGYGGYYGSGGYGGGYAAAAIRAPAAALTAAGRRVRFA